jgi:Phosphorylated adapter RNA export protein, RNA-binding domain
LEANSMATEETVSAIAKALGEADEIPLAQIAGVVQALGEEQARTLLTETLEIEGKGGMMLPDGSRRRSPGGVFFFLSRQRLSVDDKHRIFRAPKPAKPPSSSAPETSPFPRRRVIEVAAARPAPASRPPRPGFLPPELPVAVKRVKVREAIQQALTALPAEDQYGLLLDFLADLHERLGYRVPESQRTPSVFDPPTRPGAAMGEPPSSQRPIPVPESARISTSEPPVSQAAPSERKRAAASRSKRS